MTHRERHLSEGLFDLKQKPNAGQCLVSRCRREAQPKKVGLCHCHHQYRWRMRSPKKSAYATLRDHAKARGLAFTISHDYLLGLMDAYAYFDHAAESRGEYPSLDRIDGSKGYVSGNLRVITVSQNTIKSNKERHLPAHVQSILDRKRERAKSNPYLAMEQDPDACPF